MQLAGITSCRIGSSMFRTNNRPTNNCRTQELLEQTSAGAVFNNKVENHLIVNVVHCFGHNGVRSPTLNINLCTRVTGGGPHHLGPAAGSSNIVK